tara:strand:+ start:16327 stop:16791 length:465 start_codon:yes stop_codon:yes gene_type:complete
MKRLTEFLNESKVEERLMKVAYTISMEFNDESDDSYLESGFVIVPEQKVKHQWYKRGNGKKSKEMDSIVPKPTRKGNLEPNKNIKLEMISKFFKFLKQKGAKEYGQVSDFFGDNFGDALLYNKVLFINRGTSIDYGSSSRIKNKDSVWDWQENK